MNASKYRRNLFWNVPNRYLTICSDADTGEVIEERLLEAINTDEAESRAFLNCQLAAPQHLNVSVKAIMQ